MISTNDITMSTDEILSIICMALSVTPTILETSKKTSKQMQVSV